MTQENKELLLRDLCARLSYGVKVSKVVENWTSDPHPIRSINLNNIIVEDGEFEDGTPDIDVWDYEDIKLYLFPLSSLTEEQRNDISKLLIDTQNTFSPYGEINIKGCDNLFVCSVKQSNALINYCLMHHLDINGLIEKGLAIDATGKNIY